MILEARDRQLGQIRMHTGMAGPELRPVIRGPPRVKQRSGAGMVQPDLVKHHQAGITEEIGPLPGVMQRIPELVYDEIVRTEAMQP